MDNPTLPTHLVIVADDAGIDAARDRGIVDSCARGVVRAVSVLANGPHAADFARTWHDWPGPGPRPDVGLHLNLTEGRPVSSADLGPLVRDGRFAHPKRDLLRAAIDRPFDPAPIAEEARAQIARLLDLGLPVTFANGHQHAHLFPGVADGLARALDEHPSIRRVRCAEVAIRGDEPGPGSHWPDIGAEHLAGDARARRDQGWCAEAAFAALSRGDRTLVDRGRRGMCAFVGLDLIGGLTRDALLDRLARARAAVGPGACVEVMTHPGEPDAASVPFSSSTERAVERDTLCDPELPALLESAGFHVARFSDLEALVA